MDLNFDATPLESDWEDLFAIFEDMRKFADSHVGWTFLCADDPGTNHTPQRVPRMGWSAFKEPKDPYRDSEQMKSWTITLVNVRKSLDNQKNSNAKDIVSRSIKTQAGRMAMLAAITRAGAIQTGTTEDVTWTPGVVSGAGGSAGGTSKGEIAK